MAKNKIKSKLNMTYIVTGAVLLLLIGGFLLHPAFKGMRAGTMTGGISLKTDSDVNEIKLTSTKTPQEYYKMFQCPCCGKSVDTLCCGMAKQRKSYLDKLIEEGLGEQEISAKMAKKFGFGTLMDPAKEQEIRDYLKSQSPDNPPKIEIKNPTYDFGTISQSDGTVSTTFTIENTGKSDLIIENMDTSCMCTSASLIYNGEESQRFGMSMHGGNPENFELILPPRESAQLKVYYDPNAHGKQEKPKLSIVREVTIVSNDPVDFQKKARIEVTQVP